MVGPFLFATTVWTRRQVTLDHSGLKESKEADPPVILDGIHPTDLSSPPQKSRGDVAEKIDMDAVKEKETGKVTDRYLKAFEKKPEEEEAARLHLHQSTKIQKLSKTSVPAQKSLEITCNHKNQKAFCVADTCTEKDSKPCVKGSKDCKCTPKCKSDNDCEYWQACDNSICIIPSWLDRDWAEEKLKDLKAKKLKKLEDALKDGSISEDDFNLTKEWLKVWVDRKGFAPKSVCGLQGNDMNFCPEGFSSSCEVINGDCAPKWPTAKDWVEKNKNKLLDGDEKSEDPCKTLKNPYPEGEMYGASMYSHQYFTLLDGFCKEHWCALETALSKKETEGTNVCTKVTKELLNQTANLGGYGNISDEEYDRLVNDQLDLAIISKKTTGSGALNTPSHRRSAKTEDYLRRAQGGSGGNLRSVQSGKVVKRRTAPNAAVNEAMVKRMAYFEKKNQN